MKHLLTLCLLATASVAQAETKTEVTFYTPQIVRVVKYAAELEKQPAKESYSVILKPEKVKVTTQHSDGTTTMKSAALQVAVNESDGTVVFLTLVGDTLLSEKGGCRMAAIPDGVDKGRYEVSQSWQLRTDEAIFGLGQRGDPDLCQRGKSVTLWNTNGNITIPYFTSERGWGLFWDNMGRTFFDDNADGTTFRSEVADMVDYYFMYDDGTQDGVIRQIRQLTGQATMFPLWAMGHWQCRERYKTSDELAAVLDRYRELQIPLDGIVQDWQYWGCDSNWNAMRFQNPYYINKVGDPAWAKYLPKDMRQLAQQAEPRLKSLEEMVKYVHSQNAHLMISIWANFGPWTQQFAELKKMNALLPFDTWPRNNGVQPYDAFNPKARDLYWKYLTHLYQMGFDAWWTDSTEPDHFEKPGDDDYMTADGSWRSVKNAFALVHNRGIYEHQRKMKGAGNKRALMMTRSGQFGLQHYGTFSWSGDIQSNWQTMKRQVPSGLNYSICGIPFWNTDIGGFFGWDYNNDPHNPAMQELQVRWMQWGTFMPLMRNHSSSPMVNELYNFGKPGEWAYDVQRDFIRLRYRLLPYIYSTAGDVVQRSGSMMRPLVMDFAADRKASRLSDEYMFGRSLLVKPVTDPLYTWQDDRKQGHLVYEGDDLRRISAPVSVYLPAGTKWYDFWTNRVEDGGREVKRACPIHEMPVYVRAGSILPFGPDVQYSSEKPWDELEIRVYPGADGTFSLYEDEGDGYNYERGQFSLITFTWNDAARRLTIGKRQGSFKGMLLQRRFRVIIVDEQSGRGDQLLHGGTLVDYDGTEVSI